MIKDQPSLSEEISVFKDFFSKEKKKVDTAILSLNQNTLTPDEKTILEKYSGYLSNVTRYELYKKYPDARISERKQHEIETIERKFFAKYHDYFMHNNVHEKIDRLTDSQFYDILNNTNTENKGNKYINTEATAGFLFVFLMIQGFRFIGYTIGSVQDPFVLYECCGLILLSVFIGYCLKPMEKKKIIKEKTQIKNRILSSLHFFRSYYHDFGFTEYYTRPLTSLDDQKSLTQNATPKPLPHN